MDLSPASDHADFAKGVSAPAAFSASAPLSPLELGAIAFTVHKTSTLATAAQKEVEALALRLLASPEVKKQREATFQRFLADPTANTPDGKKTILNALDELAFYGALGAANSDPVHPKLIWAIIPPHAWFGHKVPGSRWGQDNPDNVYRIFTVDGTSKYEITVHPRKMATAAQFGFLLYDTFAGEDSKQKNFDEPFAGLLDRDIRTEIDGSFTITLDNSPANGRSNHIQSNSDAKLLMIRDTFSDWATQEPMKIEIKRIGGYEAGKPATERELAQKAATYLKFLTDTMLRLKNKGQQWAIDEPNGLSKPFARGGKSFGFTSPGNFTLEDDEGLLLTLDPLGAKYLSVVLADPWMVSREYIRANGSLNNGASLPNKDGSFTYVISARDPGIHNWLDTGGLHEGRILVRWQGLPEATPSIDNAVLGVKLIKLNELPTLLPPETARVTPEQRKKLYAQRAQAYARRYLAD